MNSDQIKKFYDELADDYDSMTRLDARLLKEEPIFREVVERYNLRTVLDAGCGTGFHSILLAKLGCRVTAVDVSEKMLNQLHNNSLKYGVSYRVLRNWKPTLIRVSTQYFVWEILFPTYSQSKI
jgi:ubiquinone/menaquinone biosynthesis C-methylase UbiE